MSPLPAPTPSTVDGTTAESLGLGKYLAVGYANKPTWIDPNAADWADVLANGLGWVQIQYDTVNKFAIVTTGFGAGATQAAIAAYDDGGSFSAADATGYVQGTVNGTAQLAVGGCVGQTDPLLDLIDVDGNHRLSIAPDGSVGGVTPAAPGWVIKWDGSKWVASAP